MNKKWQDWELDLLMSDVPCTEISKKIGRSLAAVYKQKERLGKTSPTLLNTRKIPNVGVYKNIRNELIIAIRKEIKEKVTIQFKR